MTTPMQQAEPEGQTVTPAQVWEHLDQVTRDRVIELFARSAYDFVFAQRRAAEEEDRDVYIDETLSQVQPHVQTAAKAEVRERLSPSFKVRIRSCGVVGLCLYRSVYLMRCLQCGS